MKQIDEKRLLLAVGEVGEDLLERSERRPVRRRSPPAKWGALAACFCLIAVLAVPHVLPSFTMGSTGNSAAPPEPGTAESGVERGQDNNEGSAVEDFSNGNGDTDSTTSPEGAVKGTETIMLIGPEDTEVTVTHILGGQRSEAVVSGAALEALRQWADTLSETMEYRAFAEGRSPGDREGGEVYMFTGANGAWEFSYVVNGPEDCYVLYENDWYAVSAPEDPPVDI